MYNVGSNLHPRIAKICLMHLYRSDEDYTNKDLNNLYKTRRKELPSAIANGVGARKHLTNTLQERGGERGFKTAPQSLSSVLLFFRSVSSFPMHLLLRKKGVQVSGNIVWPLFGQPVCIIRVPSNFPEVRDQPRCLHIVDLPLVVKCRIGHAPRGCDIDEDGRRQIIEGLFFGGAIFVIEEGVWRLKCECAKTTTCSSNAVHRRSIRVLQPLRGRQVSSG